MSFAAGEICRTEGIWSFAQGYNAVAIGEASHAEGGHTVAYGEASHAAGNRATAAQNYTYAWSDGNLGTATTNVSTTRTGQYMVSASGGMFIPGNVGIGTDSTANPLTVVGNISATGTIFAQSINSLNIPGGGNIVSSPSTVIGGVSGITEIRVLTQSDYNSLSPKLPTTMYIIL
jgi:hypothetical protein